MSLHACDTNFCHVSDFRGFWWALQDSNLRLPPCESATFKHYNNLQDPGGTLSRCKAVQVEESTYRACQSAGNIVDVIDREKIDFVVVSTHGVTSWHSIAFGSIAEKLVKLVQCPLLLLRTAKPTSSVKRASGRLMEWW